MELLAPLLLLASALFIYRWQRRACNLARLRDERLNKYRDFREFGGPTGERRRAATRFNLATRYVHRNWWWTSRVVVYVEDINERIEGVR
ncbi:MAG: hypothetical protein LC749_12590 [Actinobacteria bacterium]|nr:hypothetical protein [Actinomycetota bacterium]